eukprot:gnl/MRDRNA2_/MRDRNA2_477827_c0_seq1.p1 gnl/MRDRNA2_/MRDRNA2_477827_c0~~gnl/MRDRNA2_/MRDRNA2_477827_c0_seq1.p1  ORF type:complete len:214 (-),score=22.77 gnl/MRDRNA2_/MRDRNA2_477827_c0_seq1:33-605(-)
MDPHWGFAIAVLDTKICVIGGYQYDHNDAVGLSSVQAFDTVVGSWEWLPNLKQCRIWPKAAVMNGKIYVLGGSQRIGLPQSSSAEVFDPAVGIWADMPQWYQEQNDGNRVFISGDHITFATIDGKLYILTPPTAMFKHYQEVTEAKVFNEVTGNWEKLPLEFENIPDRSEIKPFENIPDFLYDMALVADF